MKWKYCNDVSLFVLGMYRIVDMGEIISLDIIAVGDSMERERDSDEVDLSILYTKPN